MVFIGFSQEEKMRTLLFSMAVLNGLLGTTFAWAGQGGNGWTSHVDQLAGGAVIHILSMVPHNMTCTVSWSGSYINSGQPANGQFGLLVARWPGMGAAIDTHEGLQNVTAVNDDIICSDRSAKEKSHAK